MPDSQPLSQSGDRKGEIIHVGEWDEERDAPVGWVISGADVGVRYFSDGRPPLFGGYTLEELRRIYEEHADV